MRLERDAFRKLCRARDLLYALEDDAPPVAEIARAVAISPFHFIRQFEALFGETPHQLRLRSRLEYAKRLLVTDHSVTAVCMEVGFSSLGSFSALFRRRVGVTPSAYRRRARALVQVPGALARELEPSCFGLMGLLPAEAFRNFREA
jgi:AraC-like DNA-binding protein